MTSFLNADMEILPEHLRRKDVVCTTPLLSSIVWSVSDGAEVDAGQVMGTAGLIERGNLQQLIAPCRGKLRVRRLNLVTRDAETNGAPSRKDQEMVDGGGGANDETAQPNGSEQALANGDANASGEVVVAFVEYCIHPLKNGRTCMMCLAVVDENEEDMDGERRSVNVVSHGQVLRLNIEEASTSHCHRSMCLSLEMQRSPVPSIHLLLYLLVLFDRLLLLLCANREIRLGQH